MIYTHLFKPLEIGSTTMVNRTCFLAHRTNFGQKGRLDDRHIAYYRRRAAGGCGLIIVGELSIHPNDRPWASMIETYHPDAIQRFKELTRTLHELDTPVFAQLNHYGFQNHGAISRRETWGPSAVSDVVFGEVCKPMEPEDIAELIKAFSKAALIVKESGFDGIEIDMGPESILRQFLSSVSNHRQDEYGGSLENRMRLPLEVIDAIGKTVGNDFTVGVRLCIDERFWGGITPDESLETARQFENTGQVDFFQAAMGCHYNLYSVMASMHTPMGVTIELAEQLKQSVTLPVIAGYQIGFPDMGETLLEEKKADVLGFVRALISEPDMIKKVQKGDLNDIRPCIKDNQGCIGRINQSKILGCILNPEVGYESVIENSTLLETKNIKKVMVVGAGPAGMEAARVTGEKGHDVTVYESQDNIGGQVNLAKKGVGRENMHKIVSFLGSMLDKYNIPVNTGVMVDKELITAENPDVVIVATGSIPNENPYQGISEPPFVLNVSQVLENRYPVGEKVLFVCETNGHRSAATVEFLSDQGKQVDMVTEDLFIGVELAPIGDLYLSRQRLLQKNVTFITNVSVDEIKEKQVYARNIHTGESLVYEGYDTIVIDVPHIPNDTLYHQLKGCVKELYIIGDCVAPRSVEMAIFEGRKIGESL
jgi:mycofactocin system FadH/OYE family oxidoreductase 2